MSFLNPLAFGFLAIAPVIVLLYLLKIKRRAVSVSTLMFWQRVLQENRRRALFQRLRQLLSLLLHLLIFLLILLALARPEIGRISATGATTVLIVDARARMQAMEPDGRSRFDKAADLARVVARRAGMRNEMALLSVTAGADVVAPFTGDARLLEKAITSLRPSDATGSLDAAIDLADDLLASRRGGKNIVVFTDRDPTGASNSRNGKSKVEFVTVGTPRDNVAITRFATRLQPDNPQTSEVLLEIRNFGNKPARGNVELYFDGTLADVKPFDLPPDGHRLDIFPSISRRTSGAARGWLTARLDISDALEADNQAYAVLPDSQARHVLLVTRGNWFLEKMLESDDTLRFELLTPESFKPDFAKNFDTVILDDIPSARIDVQNETGNFLFLKTTPFNASPGAIDRPPVTEVDASSPLLRLVNLRDIAFQRAASIQIPSAPGAWRFEAPLRSFDHPLIVAGARRLDDGGEQRLAAFAFDPAESDLPLRVAFPLLMTNTLRWLGGGRDDAISAVRAGETFALAPDESVEMEPQREVKSVPAHVPATATRGSFRPLRNGFYRVQNGNKERWIAVNTFSDAESDLRVAPAQARAAVVPIFSATRLAGWPLWTCLALAAFALFSLEWWLYHQRRTE